MNFPLARLIPVLLGATTVAAANAQSIDDSSVSATSAPKPSSLLGIKASDEDHRIQKYISLYYGQSKLILGSEDPRIGGGIGVGYGRFDPKLRIGNLKGELVWEGYLMESRSNGVNGDPPNTTFAVGLIASARYRWKWGQRYGVYASAGFGIQYVNLTTSDLPLNLNTTPAIGGGFLYRTNEAEYQLGVHLLHISNGGRKAPNPGQNFLVVALGVRF